MSGTVVAPKPSITWCADAAFTCTRTSAPVDGACAVRA
jgi:hypothetical protein